MKAKVICEFGAPLLVVVISLGVLAYADIGGGPGKVKTPYSPRNPASLEDVTKVKSFASTTRTLTDVVSEGTHVTKGGQNVGLMYVKGAVPAGTPLYKLEGTNDSGAKVTVDFNEIGSFVVTSDGSDATSVVVEVTQFPAITPAELIAKKPSYTDLKKDYTRTVRVRVKTKGAAGKVLCLVAKNPPAKGYGVVARLTDLPANSKVELGYGAFPWGTLSLPAIWWATESVTADKNYPFRVTVLARL
jgi:hypothetical protein